MDTTTAPPRESVLSRVKIGEFLGLFVLVGLVVAGFLVIRDTVQPGLAALKALREGTVRERRQAARELGTLKRGGVDRALETLPLSIESDRDSLVRTEAARSIGLLVTTAIKEGRSEVDLDAATRGLIIGLKDPDPNVREVSALALAGFGRFVPSAPEELHDLLIEDPEIAVRTAAVAAIAQYPVSTQRGVEVLLKGMDNDELSLRIHCSDALSRVTPPVESLDHLLVLLKHPRNEIRYRAADLIGRLGAEAERAVPELILNLSEFTPSPPRQDHDPSSAGWDPAWAAARALSQISKKTGQEQMVIDALLRNLRSSDIDRVVTSASTLETFGAKACEAVPLLIEALHRVLESPTFGERAALVASAVGALGPCDPKSSDAAVAALIKALGVRNELTQSRAAAALARFGKRAGAAVPVLDKLRTSQSLVVRFEASRAMAVITELSK